MAQIMTTMAAKTPNEMLETAIFLLYLFFLRYFLKKKLPLFEKTIERKFMEIERQREKKQRILENNGAKCRGDEGILFIVRTCMDIGFVPMFTYIDLVYK
jgi:hypothetical protein